MVGDDGRLRGNVRQNGTVSGRFSISRVQLQSIPHDFRLDGFEVLEGIPTPRGMIGAGVQPGYKLWELDLANAELRVAAMMAKCTRMLDLIHQGKDLHRSEEHTSELQSRGHLVCRLLLEKKKFSKCIDTYM